MTLPDVKQPLVSVIMPTYNHAKFIGKAIGSVLNQTHKNLELIIIDNYSVDNTEEIVKSFNDQRIKYIKFMNNGVIAASRNNGLKIAKGEWACFLDSDDWWYPKKLETVQEYTSGSDIIYHNLDIFTLHGKSFRKIKGRKLKPPVFVDLMIKGNALSSSSVSAKRDIIEKAGGFSEEKELVAVEDNDLWLKISLITDRFIFIPKSLGVYRKGVNNITVYNDTQVQRHIALYNKYTKFLKHEDMIEAEKYLSYSIGTIRRYMGQFSKSKEFFLKSLSSKDFKIKIRSIIYILIILLYQLIYPKTHKS